MLGELRMLCTEVEALGFQVKTFGCEPIRLSAVEIQSIFCGMGSVRGRAAPSGVPTGGRKIAKKTKLSRHGCWGVGRYTRTWSVRSAGNDAVSSV
jgi:hypothetical protein